MFKKRIADVVSVEREVNAWQTDRNSKEVIVDWHFTTSDARI